MPRTSTGFSITTLADHKAAGNKVTIFCVCQHSMVLSLDMLIEKFGADFEIVANRQAFLSRFRCNNCGSRPGTVQITPGQVPPMGR